MSGETIEASYCFLSSSSSSSSSSSFSPSSSLNKIQKNEDGGVPLPNWDTYPGVADSFVSMDDEVGDVPQGDCISANFVKGNGCYDEKKNGGKIMVSDCDDNNDTNDGKKDIKERFSHQKPCLFQTLSQDFDRLEKEVNERNDSDYDFVSDYEDEKVKSKKNEEKFYEDFQEQGNHITCPMSEILKETKQVMKCAIASTDENFEDIFISNNDYCNKIIEKEGNNKINSIIKKSTNKNVLSEINISGPTCYKNKNVGQNETIENMNIVDETEAEIIDKCNNKVTENKTIGVVCEENTKNVITSSKNYLRKTEQNIPNIYLPQKKSNLFSSDLPTTSSTNITSLTTNTTLNSTVNSNVSSELTNTLSSDISTKSSLAIESIQNKPSNRHITSIQEKIGSFSNTSLVRTSNKTPLQPIKTISSSSKNINTFFKEQSSTSKNEISPLNTITPTKLPVPELYFEKELQELEKATRIFDCTHLIVHKSNENITTINSGIDDIDDNVHSNDSKRLDTLHGCEFNRVGVTSINCNEENEDNTSEGQTFDGFIEDYKSERVTKNKDVPGNCEINNDKASGRMEENKDLSKSVTYKGDEMFHPDGSVDANVSCNVSNNTRSLMFDKQVMKENMEKWKKVNDLKLQKQFEKRQNELNKMEKEELKRAEKIKEDKSLKENKFLREEEVLAQKNRRDLWGGDGKGDREGGRVPISWPTMKVIHYDSYNEDSSASSSVHSGTIGSFYSGHASRNKYHSMLNLGAKSETIKDISKRSRIHDLFKKNKTKGENKSDDGIELRDLKINDIEVEEDRQNPFINYLKYEEQNTEFKTKKLSPGTEKLKNIPANKATSFLKTKAVSDGNDCVLSSCSEIDEEVFDSRCSIKKSGDFIVLKKRKETKVKMDLSNMVDLNVSRYRYDRVVGIRSTADDFRGNATIETVEEEAIYEDEGEEEDDNGSNETKNDINNELCKLKDINKLKDNFKLNFQSQQQSQKLVKTNLSQLNEKQIVLSYKQKNLHPERERFFKSKNPNQEIQMIDSNHQNVVSTERCLNTLTPTPSPTITSPHQNPKQFFLNKSKCSVISTTDITTNVISRSSSHSLISPRAPPNLLWLENSQEPHSPMDYLFSYQDKETEKNIFWCLSPSYSNIVKTSPVSTNQKQPHRSQQCCSSCHYSLGPSDTDLIDIYFFEGSFHRECFKCESCQLPFNNITMPTKKDGRYYCHGCSVCSNEQ